MNKIKGFVRKFAALVLAVVSIFSFSLSPTYAAELSQSSKATETVSSGAILRRSSKLVTCNQGYINGSGVVIVHLNSTIWGGHVGVTTSGGTGEIVRISVTLPNGDTRYLGATASNGSTMDSDNFVLLPKGDYKFYLDGIDDFYAFAYINND